MPRFRDAVFGTGLRRISGLFLTLSIFYGGGWLSHRYIDVDCTSPGLSIILVFGWFVFGCLSGLMTVICFGDRLVGPGFIDDFLIDEMSQLDERFSGEKEKIVDDVDETVLLRRAGGGLRFSVYILVLSVGHLMASNASSAQFIQRYSHPGVALIHSRSDDPQLRRKGLSMLTERLDFRVTPGVVKLVMRALQDTDEGVIARASHVAAVLDIKKAVPLIEKRIADHPALAFVLMVSLGQLESPEARLAAARLIRTQPATEEPVAAAYMVGLLKVPAIEELKQILHKSAKNEDGRVAAFWALGELRDGRLLDTIAAGLKDESLVVRCVATQALEKLVVTESAIPLMAAFEAVSDPSVICPERNLPVQEGGPTIRIVVYRPHLLSLVRAMATTDHPNLIRWLVEHQTDTEDYRTRTLMKRLWEKLKGKESRGELNSIKRRLQQKAIQQKMEEAMTPKMPLKP